MESREGCASGLCRCEKSMWKEERVVFLVYVDVKRACGKNRGLCFRFMYCTWKEERVVFPVKGTQD